MSVRERRIYLKCVEELNELAVELLQQVNKPNDSRIPRIIQEIEDVEKRLNPLKRLLAIA